MGGRYVSLLNIGRSSNYVSLLSSSNMGGETAGSVASFFGNSSNIAYTGGETAGSVASSSFGTSCSTSTSGSFSAIT